MTSGQFKLFPSVWGRNRKARAKKRNQRSRQFFLESLEPRQLLTGVPGDAVLGGSGSDVFLLNGSSLSLNGSVAEPPSTDQSNWPVWSATTVTNLPANGRQLMSTKISIKAMTRWISPLLPAR